MGDQHSVLVMEQAICCSLVILYYNLEPCKLNLEDTEIKFIEIEKKYPNFKDMSKLLQAILKKKDFAMIFRYLNVLSSQLFKNYCPLTYINTYSQIKSHLSTEPFLLYMACTVLPHEISNPFSKFQAAQPKAQIRPQE